MPAPSSVRARGITAPPRRLSRSIRSSHAHFSRHRQPAARGSANVLAILTIGPCAVLLPRPLAAQQAEAQPARLDPAVLDLLVGRVALYPDPLLAQVMAAATFSEQIPAAAQWSAQHKYLKGDALVQAMEGANLGFDPSVQSLLAFPSVLDLMNRDLGWTQQFGDASLVQRGDVMDAVQRMRLKAYETGNLKSTPQIVVVQSSPQVIEIQPPSPTVIYVPVYNPQVVYVYPPPPPPGAMVAAAALGFALAVALTPSYCTSYWGYRSGFAWHSHTVIIYNSAWGRTWTNHGVYIHTWGGYNRGFYAKPYAYTNTHAYVRTSTNVNVNRNVNVNSNYGNVNVNKNVNVNQATGNVNVNKNANVTKTYGNTTVNKNVNVNNNGGNVNVNKNTNVSGANGSANVNRNANANVNNPGNVNRSNSVNVNPSKTTTPYGSSSANQNAYKGAYQAPAQSPYKSSYPSTGNANQARGYTPQSSASSGTFSGVQNGKSEQAAAARGQASRRK